MAERIFLFVGSFDFQEDFANRAASAAGNQVQSEIFTALQASLVRDTPADLRAIVLKPLRSWPRGQLFWQGQRCQGIYFPTLLNVVRIKQMIFSTFLLVALFRLRPAFIIKYNIGLSDAFALRLYKRLNPKAFVTCVLQDVHCRPHDWLDIRRLGDLLAIRMVRAFDALVPISKRLQDDFLLDPRKTIVFPGGLTRQGRELMQRGIEGIDTYAVFAGALEKYNGIDRLIDRWCASGVKMDLHVFGQGRCEGLVRAASKRSGRIIFHGFRPEAEVTEWQARALVSFCLRYPIGIDAGYFFPSKLFNALSAPGAVVVNSFQGFPAALADTCFIIDNDLDGLKNCIAEIQASHAIEKKRLERLVWVKANGDWQVIVREILTRAQLSRKLL